MNNDDLKAYLSMDEAEHKKQFFQQTASTSSAQDMLEKMRLEDEERERRIRERREKTSKTALQQEFKKIKEEDAEVEEEEQPVWDAAAPEEPAKPVVAVPKVKKSTHGALQMSAAPAAKPSSTVPENPTRSEPPAAPVQSTTPKNGTPGPSTPTNAVGIPAAKSSETDDPRPINLPLQTSSTAPHGITPVVSKSEEVPVPVQSQKVATPTGGTFLYQQKQTNYVATSAETVPTVSALSVRSSRDCGVSTIESFMGLGAISEEEMNRRMKALSQKHEEAINANMQVVSDLNRTVQSLREEGETRNTSYKHARQEIEELNACFAAQQMKNAKKDSQHLEAIAERESQIQKLNCTLKEAHAIVNDKDDTVARLENEVIALQQKVNELTNLRKMVTDGQHISSEEHAKVKVEIEEQEWLLTASQKENAKVMAENKALLLRVKDLEKAMVKAEKQRQAEEADGASHKKDVVIASTGSPEHAQLIREHEKLKKERAVTEEEHKLEVETIRKDKRELERRLASVDWAKVEDDELAIRTLKAQMKRQQQEHLVEREELERKVAWYVDHQQVNSNHHDLINELQTTVQQQRVRILDLESQLSQRAGPKEKMMKTYQKRIADLEDVIRSKYPNSLPELIRAAKPDVTESKVVRELEHKVAELTEKLSNQEASAEAMLSQLRLDKDQLHEKFKQRMHKMEDEMRTKLQAAQSRKVKDLEKSLVDTRQYYTTKVKELEQQVVVLRRNANKQGNSSTLPRPVIGRRPPASRDAHHSDPSKDGDNKPATVETQTIIGGGQDDGNVAIALGNTAGNDAAYTAIVHKLHDDNLQLQQQLAMTQAAMSKQASPQPHFAQVPNVAATQVQHQVPLILPSDLSTLSTLQNQLGIAHKEIAIHRRLLSEAQELHKNDHFSYEDRLQRLRADHQHEITELRKQHEDEKHSLRKKYESDAVDLAQRLTSTGGKSDSVFGGLRAELPMRKKMKEADVAEYLTVVSEKLRRLEQELVLKDHKHQSVLEDVKRMAQYELSVERQRMSLAIQEKNNEIRGYRVELDSLLAEIGNLQAP